MKNKYFLFSLFLFGAFLLAGCTVGPDFSKPDIDSPPSFSRLPDTKLENTAGEGRELQIWWSYFGDDSLTALIDQALVSNQDLAIAASRVRQARAFLQEADSEFYPGSRLQQSYRSTQTSASNPMTGQRRYGFELWTLGIDSIWEIDLFGGLRRNQEARQSELEASEYTLFDVQRVLSAEVGRNYVLYRQTEQEIELTQQIVELEEDTLRIVKAKFSAGEVGEFDVARAESQVAATRAQLPILQAARRSSESRLSVLLARQPTASLNLKSAQVAAAMPHYQGPVTVVNPATLLTRRPDLRALEAKLHAETARVGVEESQYYPQVSFSGTLALEATSPQNWTSGGTTAYSILPSISWKVFDNGSIDARVKAAGARAEQALLEYRKLFLLVLEEVENSLASFAAERARRHDLLASVASSEKAHQLAKIQYEAGEIELLNVIDAQRALFARRLASLNSDANLTLAIISIYKAFGGGWNSERDVLENNGDPQANNPLNS